MRWLSQPLFAPHPEPVEGWADSFRRSGDKLSKLCYIGAPFFDKLITNRWRQNIAVERFRHIQRYPITVHYCAWGCFSEKTIRGDREALYALTPVLLPQAGEGSVGSVRCSRDRLREGQGPKRSRRPSAWRSRRPTSRLPSRYRPCAGPASAVLFDKSAGSCSA